MHQEAIHAVVYDMLANCAQAESGHHVTVIAATDGLERGRNIVDRKAVDFIVEGIRSLGAEPAVLWADMRETKRANVLRQIQQAVQWSDRVVSLMEDLAWEENTDFRDIMRERNVPVVRNMATTENMLRSSWAELPYNLVSQIRFVIGLAMHPGATFRITHDNGTDLTGVIASTVGSSPRTFTQMRSSDLYRPFPEGVYVPMRAASLDGVLVFDGMLPEAAGYVGLPYHFRESVRLMIDDGFVREIRGGAEADVLSAFLAEASLSVGKKAYDIGVFHGGVHPYARLSPDECENRTYRYFVEHHHIGSLHFHLADLIRKDNGHRLQLTCEVRGSTFRVGDVNVLRRGVSSVLRDPQVRDVAASHMNVPSVRQLFDSAGAWQAGLH